MFFKYKKITTWTVKFTKICKNPPTLQSEERLSNLVRRKRALYWSIFLLVYRIDQCCGASRSRWSRNYLRSIAGTEFIFLINIYSSQFGGCQDEDKLVSTSFGMVLLLQNSFKWQCIAGAGAGDGDGVGAKIRNNGGAGAENK